MTDQARVVSTGRLVLGRVNAAAAVVLLAAGGMVTSTDSGLAVPDWPLSYGRWLPAMTGGVFFEHGHRMIASLVGLLILVMAAWTQLEEPRPAVRRLAWWTLLAVCVQGVLGGVTVYLGLPTAVSAAHATLGQTTFCLLVAMADLVTLQDAGPAAAPAGRLRALAAAAVAALWTQLVLGSILRHGGGSLSSHVAGACVAAPLAGALGAAALARPEPVLRGPARALLGLLGLQLVLGLLAADFRSVPAPRASHPMIVFATLHVVVGALTLGSAALCAARAFRLRA